MDDLSGLDWSAKPGTKPANPPMGSSNYYPSLKPSPSPFASGRSTPLSAQPSASSGKGASPAPQKVAGDSFSGLMNFSSQKANSNLSLAERQAQVAEERRRKEEEQRKKNEAQFGNGQFWDALGSRGSGAGSPAAMGQGLGKPTPPPPAAPVAQEEEDDLFAAFNKDTKVDKSSHYPPPESRKSTPANPLDLSDPSAWGSSSNGNGNGNGLSGQGTVQNNNLMMNDDDDDDPFGLSEAKTSTPAPALAQTTDDDDFLGDLARPVDEIRREQEAEQARRRQQEQQAQQARRRAQPGKPIEGGDSDSDDNSSAPATSRRGHGGGGGDVPDQTLAQLVDYGFSAEDARRAILESGAGTNAQVAVNWLLDEAHRKSKAASQGRSASAASGPSQPRQPPREGRSPAQDQQQPDLAKSAAAVGNSLFKTANSLWKTGQKKMQQAVADFNQEPQGGDPSQPKWMRDAIMAERQAASAPSATQETGTDEAMMLDSGRRPEPKPRPQTQTQRQPSQTRFEDINAGPRRDPAASGGSSRSSPVPRWQQQSAPPAPQGSRARRLVADDDISSYSSPNRRRKQAAPVLEVKAEENLLFGSEAPKQTLPTRPAAKPEAQRTASQPARRPEPKRAPVPPRAVPNISAIALQNSTTLRHQGTAHFKRGDYASAHASYASALQGIPPTHPLAIVLLTNRALTALKTGEPKQAITDADAAIKVIGEGKGAGETVAVRNEEGKDEARDMRELYGKALSRKAEALENLERWADAGAVWQLAVEAGLGGATAVKGRQRCQAALAPKAKPKPRPSPAPRPASTPAKPSEAVTRLRAQNLAAEKEDDEKFELSEKVDARVGAWRDGKRENLRALLGSMQNVLWEGSGWKTVGLAELVMANKVKIVYMKAIAKVHPDKIPQDATTEQRLIAGLVFSTLNESWDKFKADNNL